MEPDSTSKYLYQPISKDDSNAIPKEERVDPESEVSTDKKLDSVLNIAHELPPNPKVLDSAVRTEQVSPFSDLKKDMLEKFDRKLDRDFESYTLFCWMWLIVSTFGMISSIAFWHPYVTPGTFVFNLFMAIICKKGLDGLSRKNINDIEVCRKSVIGFTGLTLVCVFAALVGINTSPPKNKAEGYLMLVISAALVSGFLGIMYTYCGRLKVRLQDRANYLFETA